MKTWPIWKPKDFKKMILNAVEAFPNFKVAATTLRTVKTATINSWGAICYYQGEFFEATHRPDLEIMDRVGGGDSFASGLIYGFLATGDAGEAVEYGAAHGALAMTTPGRYHHGYTGRGGEGERGRICKGG